MQSRMYSTLRAPNVVRNARIVQFHSSLWGHILVRWLLHGGWYSVPHHNSFGHHWGRVTHICIGRLSITGSDNGLSTGRRQAIILTNAGILLIEPLGNKFQWNFNRNSNISIKDIQLKLSSGKWRPFCLGLNELINLLYQAISFVGPITSCKIP